MAKGVSECFVGDNSSTSTFNFKSNTSIQDGVNCAIGLNTNWKLAETTDGIIGVANKNDTRFDPVSIYSFVRDHNCFSYDIGFDDSEAVSRVCVYSQGNNEEVPDC